MLLPTAIPQYHLLSTVNFSLSGTVADNLLDGETLINNMVIVLTAQDTTSEIGIYSVSVIDGNYTLSFLYNLNTGTNFSNPFNFTIFEGVSNSGYWLYIDDGIAATFTKKA